MIEQVMIIRNYGGSMKTFVLIALLLIPSVVLGSPFLITDPNQDCANCFYEIEDNGSQMPDQHPTESDGSIKYDLESISPGQHTYRLRYGKTWSADAMEPGDDPQVEYSEWSDPFELTRPDVSSIPSGQRLKR